MSDHSLMNPDHLRKEIYDLETTLIPDLEQLEHEMRTAADRIIAYVAPTQNAGQPTTLTTEQVSDLIDTMAKVRLHSWKYAHAEIFAVKVYKNLLNDRRWIIGSKLRFLRKK